MAVTETKIAKSIKDWTSQLKGTIYVVTVIRKAMVSHSSFTNLPRSLLFAPQQVSGEVIQVF